MLQLTQTLALAAAALATGLIAGLFYAYSCSVMPGLQRTNDRTFIEAMQAINEAILNAWFALSFVGALLFTLLAAALHLAGPDRRALPWIIVALILYLATLVITGRVNVPLNNQLATAHADETDTDHTAIRARFEAGWNRWNHIRTVTSTAALTCLVVALAVG